ncbi:MAG TPA: PAS domain S-box protein [Gemmatimonadaceae bacterium]|nr:PAS domain S-box protein [Gemmatimonadaceae bacterium]
MTDPFEHFPIGVYRTAPDGTLLYANEALQLVLRYSTRAELLGSSVLGSYLNPADRGGWIETIERDGDATQEIPITCADGTLIWVLDSARAIRDSAGVTKWYEGALQDITKRREAEQRLQQERCYFGNLFEGLPEAIAILDKEDRVVRINSHFTKLFEYTPAEAEGRKIGELIVPHESTAEGSDISSRVAAGETVEAQLLRRTKSGRLVSVSLLGTPFAGPANEASVYAVYRDNSAQVQAREALETSQRRFQSMIENGSDMITIFTRDGRRTYISPSLTRTLGEFASELVGQSVLELIHPDDKKRRANLSAGSRSIRGRPGRSSTGGVVRAMVNGGCYPQWRRICPRIHPLAASSSMPATSRRRESFRNRCAGPTRWKLSGDSQEESRTTSTIFSPSSGAAPISCSATHLFPPSTQRI